MIGDIFKTNNFRVNFHADFGISPLSIMGVTKPKFKNGVWDNIDIQVLNMKEPSTTKAVHKLIENFQNCKAHAKDTELTSYVKEIYNKNYVSIYDLDNHDKPVNHWNIKIDELYVDFGDCDYVYENIDNLSYININIKPLLIFLY